MFILNLPRYRPPISNTEYDQFLFEPQYDSEIESSIPRGVQNVYQANTGRLTRSKAHHKVSPINQKLLLTIY